jgi:hypothetical protein
MAAVGSGQPSTTELARTSVTIGGSIGGSDVRTPILVDALVRTQREERE